MSYSCCFLAMQPFSLPQPIVLLPRHGQPRWQHAQPQGDERTGNKISVGMHRQQ